LYTDGLYHIPAYGGQITLNKGVIHYKFSGPNDISETAKARVVVLYTGNQVGNLGILKAISFAIYNAIWQLTTDS